MSTKGEYFEKNDDRKCESIAEEKKTNSRKRRRRSSAGLCWRSAAPKQLASARFLVLPRARKRIYPVHVYLSVRDGVPGNVSRFKVYEHRKPTAWSCSRTAKAASRNIAQVQLCN